MADFYRVLVFVALLNGLVLIAALLLRKQNRLANVLLSASIAAGLYFQLILYLKLSGRIFQHPRLYRTGFPASLLDVPLLYLYVRALTVPGFRWSRRCSLHLLPFVFGLAWYFAFYALPLDSPYWTRGDELRFETYARNVIGVAICGAYLGACFFRLHAYRGYVRNYFSELRRVRLHWLQWLLALVSLPWLVELVNALIGPGVTLERVTVPVVTVVILMMGFFGLRQSAIFASDEAAELTPSDGRERREERYEPFDENELRSWKEKLDAYMDGQKPYLNPELRLSDLAHAVGLKAYQLSEVINRRAGTNFYEYVNGYRVEEAKRRLLDPAYAHMNILGIAVDSGFNSKSVFNDVFRKTTGKTPSTYRSGPEKSP
ncbi:MAG TPA: helix-turn-helix domain-containing protein [bacterium]|nr:helix-turn-helix domain-containing protein [bacterium]